MRDREVAEDPDLRTHEKETTIRFANDQDRLRIASEQAAVIRWLLNHPEYEETNARVKGGVQHATVGTLPVGALKLKGKTRKTNTPSSVLGSLPESE